MWECIIFTNINVIEETKDIKNDKFKKRVKELKQANKMEFINYFTCRTQRVQLKADTESIGKKNFGDLLSKKGASIVINKKSSKKQQKDNGISDDILDNADNPEAMLRDDEHEDKDEKDEYLVQTVDEKQENYIQYLYSANKDEMLFMLETGLNLLIYGVGSKINFIRRFTTGLKGHPLLVVNGFHPGITLKHTLRELTGFINSNFVKSKSINLKQMHKFFSMHDNIEYLLKTLSIESLGIPKIYIVIISLDGGNLKSLEIQRHLSTLAR